MKPERRGYAHGDCAASSSQTNCSPPRIPGCRCGSMSSPAVGPPPPALCRAAGRDAASPAAPWLELAAARRRTRPSGQTSRSRVLLSSADDSDIVFGRAHPARWPANARRHRNKSSEALRWTAGVVHPHAHKRIDRGAFSVGARASGLSRISGRPSGRRERHFSCLASCAAGGIWIAHACTMSAVQVMRREARRLRHASIRACHA